MAKLILSDIQIQPVVHATVETLAEAETQSYLPVELRLRNNGRAKKLHFVSRPRSIRYDPDSRQLSLGFEEPDPTTLVQPEFRIPPQIDCLEPRCETTLTIRVPLVLKKIRTTERVDKAIVEFDLSTVASVACRVAYSEKAFYRLTGETAIDMVRRFHAWGKRAELVADVSIPPPVSNGGYPFQQNERGNNADIK